ncbi:c-type cytochrome [Derxia lacustris]|uniref:c-type cytochrome n=1 Tax=Derxia lacustris TaxID=764842 RepID=UPI00111C2355|nr:c-type cytochrome [Derxia lacustris]
MSDNAIKSPKQFLTAVLVIVVAVVVGILLIATTVNVGDRSGEGSRAQTSDAIGERIAPVAAFELKAAPTGPRTPRTGEEIFKAACNACHGTGAAGAPKVGTADWAPRIAQGYDALLKSALAGKNAMPPRGGLSDAMDVEIGRGIVYMANQSGAKFKEPEVPADAK